MLSNNKVKFVLSIVVAIVIWGYVMTETNPIESRTIKDIPIAYVNEDSLANDGLALLFKSSEVVSVTFEGNRTDVTAIDRKDIVATVDLADATEGENNLRVSVHVPDSVDILSQTPSKVTVTTESIATKEVDIQVEYEGTFEDELEPVTVEMSHEKISVTGAKSLVDSVYYVKAVVPEGSVSNELKTITCDLVPVDRNGETVRNVELEYYTVNVTTEIAKTKTVPLKVPIVDNSGMTKETSAPRTIVIKGMGSDIDIIDSIEAETIDLTDVKENTVLDIIPILPVGVSISEQSQDALLLVVTIPELQTKKFTFTEADVRISNLAKGYQAEVEQGEFLVEVTGSIDVLDQIDAKDIVLFVDLKGLKNGKTDVVISATCEKAFEDINIKPKKIKITITRNTMKTEPDNKNDDGKTDEPATPPESDNDDGDNDNTGEDDVPSDDSENSEG